MVISAKSSKPLSAVYLRILPPETPVKKAFPVVSKAKASGPDLFPGIGSFWKDASSEKTADERERRRREIKKTDKVIVFLALFLISKRYRIYSGTRTCLCLYIS